MRKKKAPPQHHNNRNHRFNSLGCLHKATYRLLLCRLLRPAMLLTLSSEMPTTCPTSTTAILAKVIPIMAAIHRMSRGLCPPCP